MKIASSQLFFNADRKYEENHVATREVEFLEEERGKNLSSSRTISEPVKTRIMPKTQLFPAQIDVPEASSNDEVPADPKLAAMKRMLDALMGKRLKLTNISGFQSGTASTASQSNVSTPSSFANLNSPTSNLRTLTQNNLNIDLQNIEIPQIPQRRIKITEFNSHYESESTKFNAFGSVKTESGQSIDFKLHLDMKREFYSENRSQIIGDANLLDPLVINFSGEPAELTDVKFKFDLNSDGKEENLSWLSSGSGFLVFDKNRDGVVNNGSEMFGPTTNNGFEELSQLDDDKNGWIDENDAAFENLSVWSGDSPENATLKSLKESGIGAIALANEQTEFTIKDPKSQQTLGQIRRSGIYIEESGKVSTIQQLDLAI